MQDIYIFMYIFYVYNLLYMFKKYRWFQYIIIQICIMHNYTYMYTKTESDFTEKVYILCPALDFHILYAASIAYRYLFAQKFP